MKASTERVLSMLREAGDRGVTTGEFAAGFCPRAAARLCELRKSGHVISSHRMRDNAYRFTLQQEPVGSGAEVPGVGSSGTRTPAPATSDAPLPAEVAVPLFELPAPGESPDADRWHGADVWDDVA